MNSGLGISIPVWYDYEDFYGNIKPIEIIFQFQYGTIMRLRCRIDKNKKYRFQFQYGTIMSD